MADLRSFFKAGSGALRPLVHAPACAKVLRGRQRVRPRTTEPARDPKRIITWNANGFMTRVSSPEDLAAFQELVRKHDPDLICLQEARIKAYCENAKAKVTSTDSRDRSRPLDSEKGPLDRALKCAPLEAYDVFWSLANGRAAGTAMFVHRRLGDGVMVNCLDSALALCRSQSPSAKHNAEGRIQYMRFKGFDLMNTYVPNNGWTSDRHAERRRWDEEMEAFLNARAKATDRALLWCGDLNVVHRPPDSTSEDVFRAEWDRDSKRFDSREAYMAATPERDRGIPGFSDNERSRFDRLLVAGSFVDAWRRLHPSEDAKPEDPAFTWRGTTAVQSRFRARYEGMGQRLDYFLLPEALAARVSRCEILGWGTERSGFLGSDHCPVLLELADSAGGTGSDPRPVVVELADSSEGTDAG